MPNYILRQRCVQYCIGMTISEATKASSCVSSAGQVSLATMVTTFSYSPHAPVAKTRMFDRTYLIDTPKHLIAMAASKKTAALGNVISATVKKAARLCGAFAAQRDSKYKPKAPTVPENTHVIMPGMRPAEAMAYSRGKLSYVL